LRKKQILLGAEEMVLGVVQRRVLQGAKRPTGGFNATFGIWIETPAAVRILCAEQKGDTELLDK
jgi:hypothetical protein